ncbi:MAG: hypothetical protein U9R53_09970 [Chloroflexota bacterium]|nr:hypothetical protein [Chloroflexota bacterium]
MGDILKENHAIFLGLYTALARTRSSSRVVYQKIIEAQRQYFTNLDGNKLTENQAKTLEVLDEAMHKFYLAGYTLEQLWGVHHYLKVADRGLPDLYDENLTSRQNEILFMLSSLLDQALYSWRSFLDFYLKYLVLFLTGEYIISASTSEFRKK